MSKPKISISNRKKNLTVNNRRWFEKYISRIKAQGKTRESIKQYSNIIINLLEEDIEKDISEVDLDTFTRFIYKTEKGTRVNFKIGRIQDFLRIVEQDVETRVKPEDLEQFKSSKNDLERDKRKAEPLNIIDIVKIRNILKNDLNKLFIFEMVYQLGVTLDELEEITWENYNFDTNTFRFSTRTLRVTEKIANIISSKSKVLSQKTRSAYSYNISEIGEMINRKLIWRDIIETRNEYFFRCSLCNKQYENIPENWALLQFENDVDNVKWIVCKNCTLKGSKYE